MTSCSVLCTNSESVSRRDSRRLEKEDMEIMEDMENGKDKSN
jgi:hypothetical protein